MTNSIETDLVKVLEKIDSKIDKLSEDVNDLKVGQAEIKGEFKRLETETQAGFKRFDSDISTIKDDIKEIKGSQKAQIWTLIGALISILVAAVGGFIVTIWRQLIL